MLIVTILSLLLILVGILAVLAIGSWFLTGGSVLATILIPIGAIILYQLLKILVRKLKLKRMHDNLGPKAGILEQDGMKFRDLNKNGKLDVYEDSRQPVEKRVENLLDQMTIEEKAGLMFSPMMGIGKDGELKENVGLLAKFPTSDVIIKRKISTFAVMGTMKTAEFVKWYNSVQKLGERTRLGIPITVCSDPRHYFMDSSNRLANLLDASLSKWPTPLGMAATRDEKLVEEFGDIARQELSAMGVRFALHPNADLTTEPRWGRIRECFSEDAELSGKMIAAYIRGFQGPKIGPESVACCVKHFPGGGPQKEGFDPHYAHGAEQVYPGNNIDYHKIPFEKAFEAGAAATMPYYGKPIGIEGLEEVGFNFNKQITTDLLRNKMNFKGIVHTDYGIISAFRILGVKLMGPMAWGVEKLTRIERVERAVDAGVDQIGGEACVKLLIKLVEKGKLLESRLDESCRRVLKLKFQQGLFDNPYVNEEKALEICGRQDFVEAGENAMRKSLVLLKNGLEQGKPVLPLSSESKLKVYVEGFDKELVGNYSEVVHKPEKADFALLNIVTPSRPDFKELFSIFFKGGDLDFTDKQRKHVEDVMSKCPTIFTILLDRPAVIPDLKEKAAGIIGNFSVKPEIMLDLIFGKFKPTGKLPFELPSSMEAVRKQKSDVPYDSENPSFPFGFGLTYV